MTCSYICTGEGEPTVPTVWILVSFTTPLYKGSVPDTSYTWKESPLWLAKPGSTELSINWPYKTVLLPTGWKRTNLDQACILYRFGYSRNRVTAFGCPTHCSAYAQLSSVSFVPLAGVKVPQNCGTMHMASASKAHCATARGTSNLILATRVFRHFNSSM